MRPAELPTQPGNRWELSGWERLTGGVDMHGVVERAQVGLAIPQVCGRRRNLQADSGFCREGLERLHESRPTGRKAEG